MQKLITKILRSVWQEAENRYDVAAATRCAHSDVLLYTELFSLSGGMCFETVAEGSSEQYTKIVKTGYGLPILAKGRQQSIWPIYTVGYATTNSFYQ